MKMETKLHNNSGTKHGYESMQERLYASVSKALLALMLVVAYAVPAQATTRISYIHNDHLGTPQVMTDESGTVVWRADYRPFGEADVTVNSLGNDLRFPGQIYDEETGLHYNYFRDYDPGTGRYVQSDPIGLLGGISTYAYVSANPMINIDFLGLAKLCKRRLAGFPFSTDRLSHSQIFKDDGTNIGFFSKNGTTTGPGIITDDTGHSISEYSCSSESYPDKDVDKVLVQVKSTWDMNYDLYENNCHDFANEIFNRINPKRVIPPEISVWGP